MKKSYDAVYVERYTDRDGNEKKRYINVGALFTREDGSMSLKLESIPVNFTGWLAFYEPKPKDAMNTQQSQQRKPSSSSKDTFEDDDLPF